MKARMPNRLVERRAELESLIHSRHYGITQREIADAMPDDYPDFARRSTSQRKMHRDLKALKEKRTVVSVGNPGLTHGYIHPARAHYRREEVD